MLNEKYGMTREFAVVVSLDIQVESFYHIEMQEEVFRSDRRYLVLFERSKHSILNGIHNIHMSIVAVRRSSLIISFAYVYRGRTSKQHKMKSSRSCLRFCQMLLCSRNHCFSYLSMKEIYKNSSRKKKTLKGINFGYNVSNH